MNDSQLKEVLGRIDALAGKLGVGAETLWAALLRQAPIDFWTSMVFLALCVIGGYFFFKKYLPFVARLIKANSEQEITAVFGAGLGGLFLLVVALAFVYSMPTIVASLINPEYWALEKLMDLVRKK